MSYRRRWVIETLSNAIAEKHFPSARYQAHAAMGKGLLRKGCIRYLSEYVLATGDFPHGEHDIIWNDGDACEHVDFDALYHALSSVA
jgi:hypothetical protein